MNTIWMTIEIENATIHNVSDDTSVSALVSTLRRLSVQIKLCNTVSSLSFFLFIIKPSRFTGCLHYLPYLQSHKQFPLNLLHVRLLQCPLQGY